MRLEKLEDKLLIWETGRQTNNTIYDSTNNLKDHPRRNLSIFETFLRKHSQIKESDKIKSFLGKIIRTNDIPELIKVIGSPTSVRLSYLKKHQYDDWLNDGLDMNVDFQRDHVWNLRQRIKYIEFILQGGQSNPLYFNKTRRDSDICIVDGKQRLTSVMMFLNDEFPVLEELDPEGIGYYSSQFDRLDQKVTFIENDLPNKKLVLQWYLNMNEGNIAHTEEELDKVRKLLKEE